MTVEIEPHDGRMRFTLGPIEKVIVGAIGTALSLFLWRSYDSITSKLDAVVVQQAVTNQRLGDLTTQMTDLPSIKLEVAKHAVLIEQNSQQIQELRQTKGLK